MQKQIQNEIEEKQRNKKNPLKIIFIIMLIILAIGIIHYAVNYDKYTKTDDKTTTETVVETE